MCGSNDDAARRKLKGNESIAALHKTVPSGEYCHAPLTVSCSSQTVEEVKEACATIRKAMVQINELSATMSAQNINQMTRWVNTKEEHAKKIITIISGSGPVAIIAIVPF